MPRPICAAGGSVPKRRFLWRPGRASPTASLSGESQWIDPLRGGLPRVRHQPGAIRNGAGPRQQANLAGFDLQGEVLGVDAALGQTARDKPEARLRGARKHIAQLLFVAEPPDGADARSDLVPEQLGD